MVGLRCTVLSVGMVVGGPVSLWRRQPVGRRSHIDPCMSGWFDAGRLVCGLFVVVPLSRQPFGLCLGVLAALWSACSSLGFFCCCRRCRVLGRQVDDVCAVGSFVQRSACAQPVMVSHCGFLVGDTK